MHCFKYEKWKLNLAAVSVEKETLPLGQGKRLKEKESIFNLSQIEGKIINTKKIVLLNDVSLSPPVLKKVIFSKK